jgi:hypothetical protein
MERLPSFLTSAWCNGSTGFGLKLAEADRNRFLKREWKTIELFLPDDETPAVVNIAKPSMWDGSCRELIHSKIGHWFKAAGLYPWPKGEPPKVRIMPIGERAFRVIPPVR